MDLIKSIRVETKTSVSFCYIASSPGLHMVLILYLAMTTQLGPLEYMQS